MIIWLCHKCHKDKITELILVSFFVSISSETLDQLELPPRIYNCLKRSNIHTLLELLSHSQDDLMKFEHFRVEDGKSILDILKIQKYFA